jgi:hypothetical protein
MALDGKHESHDAKFEEVGPFESPGIQPAVRPEDPATVEERRLVRKLDRRILPIACLMYLFACQYHYIGLGLLSSWTSTHCDEVRSGPD